MTRTSNSAFISTYNIILFSITQTPVNLTNVSSLRGNEETKIGLSVAAF